MILLPYPTRIKSPFINSIGEQYAKNFSVSAIACLSLASCQVVTDTLDTGLNVLKTANSVLSGNPSSSSASSQTYISEHTKSSLTAAINKATAKNDAKKLFNDARESIEKVIALDACNASASQLRAYNYENNMLSYVPPSELMHYHSGCLNVLRIINIQKQSANAVKFRVDYISPKSEETAQRFYEAIRQDNGEWLFKFSIY